MTDRSMLPRAFVIGWPIAHSRSPLIHGYWLRELGLAGSYERLPVPPEEIGAFLGAFASRQFVGGNVTVPHKEAAFAAAIRREAPAEQTGAANTLWLEAGRLCATNTDPEGFLANLDAAAPGWDQISGHALVLGAGGAARAVVWALRSRGVQVAIVNRTLARAADLADRFAGTSAHGWDALPQLLSGAGILVNTTTLGMAGKGDLAIDLAPLSTEALVTDIVYVPLLTPLLVAARARGNRVVDGLGMLLHQAVPGFERWFGVRPSVTPELRALVIADMEAAA